jgi:4-amino-4-deoxy-L-arabinose transferase-like glycosyltransferase
MKTLFDKFHLNEWIEVILLVLITSVALLFRLWQLDILPAGLHYDEAIDLRQGLRILSGDYFLYTIAGWGREALYYYVLAGMLYLIPSNLLALRLTAVLCSVGVILTSYWIARHFANPLTAWFTAAWLSITYWPLFTSRFGVRHISLPFMLGLTVVAFWRAWDIPTGYSRRKVKSYLLAGVLLGLTLYTYQPARFIPSLFMTFFIYLFLFHRFLFHCNLRGFIAFGCIALAISLPLIVILVTNPIPEAERAWTIQPLTQLLARNPTLVWENVIATSKMFTFSGDPLIAYNVPGRPVFVPVWTGIFFYAGFALAAWRWRQPVYGFVLIWLLIMLAPTVLTTSAPNYNRAIAAQTAVMFLAALPLVELIHWIMSRWGQQASLIPFFLGIASLVFTARATWHDYFVTWPQAKPETWAIQYNIGIHAIANYLKDDNDDRPILINSRNLGDSDPYILYSTLDRHDLTIRWVDTGQAIAMPSGQNEARLFLAVDRWVDSDLSDFICLSSDSVYSSEQFAIYEIRFSDWEADAAYPIRYLPATTSFSVNTAAEAPAISLPVSFQGKLQLESIHSFPSSILPGDVVTFISTWQIQQDGEPLSLAFFAHLLSSDGQLVAQQDGLGYPPHSWDAGDHFVHVHHIQTDPNLPTGQYWLQLGLYERKTGLRWQVVNDDEELGDRLLLGPLVVE